MRHPLRLSDPAGHLDQAAVVEAMVTACPRLRAVLAQDEDLIAGLPCLQVSWIAKALVDLVGDDVSTSVGAVLEVAELVLVEFGQEGRNFIGACMIEGIPDGDAARLTSFAGPLTIALMKPFLQRG
jgi:hypothetical protein